MVQGEAPVGGIIESLRIGICCSLDEENMNKMTIIVNNVALFDTMFNSQAMHMHNAFTCLVYLYVKLGFVQFPLNFKFCVF